MSCIAFAIPKHTTVFTVEALRARAKLLRSCYISAEPHWRCSLPRTSGLERMQGSSTA